MIFRTSTTRGFTLIELLVVISIIGLLSSVVMSSLNTARMRARDSKRIQDLVQMRTALEIYAQDHGGQYPMSLDSTGAVSTAFIGTTATCSDFSNLAVPANGLVPTYISKIPSDPKPIGSANCYLYAGNGTDYKFMVFETVEAIPNNTTVNTSSHPFHDRNVSGRLKSLSVYSPGAVNW